MGTKKESNQVRSINIEHHTSAINRMPIKVLIIERERAKTCCTRDRVGGFRGTFCYMILMRLYCSRCEQCTFRRYQLLCTAC